MARDHRDDFGSHTTRRCEQALVTLIGDIGPWSSRVVLVGGLAPRYLIGKLPLGVSPHVGTTDVDLVIRLAVDQEFETYKTLATNLKNSGYARERDSFQSESFMTPLTPTGLSSENRYTLKPPFGPVGKASTAKSRVR